MSKMNQRFRVAKAQAMMLHSLAMSQGTKDAL
jgi:hypothetical protein